MQRLNRYFNFLISKPKKKMKNLTIRLVVVNTEIVSIHYTLHPVQMHNSSLNLSPDIYREVTRHHIFFFLYVFRQNKGRHRGVVALM